MTRPSLHSLGQLAARRRATRLEGLMANAERRMAFAAEDALAAERRAAAARLELARAEHHLKRAASHTRLEAQRGSHIAGVICEQNPAQFMADAIAEGWSRAPSPQPAAPIGRSGGPIMSDLFTDTPSELAENSDGVGCGAGCMPSGANIAGLPWYAMQRASVSPAAARRRFLDALSKLPPKMRRRVLSRLRAVAAARSRVSGIRSITPSIGWSGVSVGRCPLSHVTGILTP